MSRHHPRRRGLHAVGETTVLQVPDEAPAVVDLGPAPEHVWPDAAAQAPAVTLARPDLLAGAVRAELLADDWRQQYRATAVLEPVGLQTAAEALAETATEQADDLEELEEEFQDAPVEPEDGAAAPGGGEWAQVEAASDRDFNHVGERGTDEFGRVGDWSSKHDGRSLEYGVRSRLDARAPLVDRVWPHGPVFDQGLCPPLSAHDASGCTGYAFTAAVNICRPELGLGAGDAFDLYLCAQKRDAIPGEAYAGTSVLAAAQEAKARGWIDAYLWCFGLGDIAQALLQVGPVVLGIPWLTQMAVDSSGILTPGGDRAGLGHAIACIGILREYAGRPGPWFVLQQSYGPAAGVGGLLYVHADQLRGLLRGVGEACVPVIGED